MTARIPTLLRDLLAALAMVGLSFLGAVALPSLEPSTSDTLTQQVKTLHLSADSSRKSVS